MINREMQTVQLLTYSNTVDEYGQKRTETPTSTNIQMVLKIYSQSNVNDPRYVDVEMLGITDCKTITTANRIKVGNDYYNILYIIPSSRHYQVLMKRGK